MSDDPPTFGRGVFLWNAGPSAGVVLREMSTVDLTGQDHLTKFRLNPAVKNEGGGQRTRAYRSLFGKFDEMDRGKLVRAVYDAGWTVTTYPGVDSMNTNETDEAEYVWFGGTVHTFTDRFGGLVTALTTAGYTAT